ncbi:MAG: hypothetical protein JNG85_11825 [Spirochaetaceae bacterium]|nr:hypothetical protein [Spirochaetaceae bacterium]
MILSVFVASAFPVFAILSAPVEVPFIVRECSLPASDIIALDPAEFAIASLPAQGVGPWSAGSSKARARLNEIPLGCYFIRRALKPP